MEIRRVNVLQAGKVLGVLYALLAVILVPFFVIGVLSGGKNAAPMLLMIFVYPVMGFLAGVIGAALYNLVARWVGGLKIDLVPEE